MWMQPGVGAVSCRRNTDISCRASRGELKNVRVSQNANANFPDFSRADSVTWNPHKLLAAPQQCSAFLIRHKGLLSECHSTNATYLFQKDKFYDVKYDTGDKHIQCGRRGDVLKFWFMWKAKVSFVHWINAPGSPLLHLILLIRASEASNNT